MTVRIERFSQEQQQERLQHRLAMRCLSADEFIEGHASGTLRKNRRLGMAWKKQYLHERVAWEFGWGFDSIPSSRVTLGVPYSEADSRPLTELGWHTDRVKALSLFSEDVFEPKYIQVEYQNGKRKEGVGIVLMQTSAPYIPSGHTVFAFTTEYNVKKEKWHESRNPF